MDWVDRPSMSFRKSICKVRPSLVPAHSPHQQRNATPPYYTCSRTCACCVYVLLRVLASTPPSLPSPRIFYLIHFSFPFPPSLPPLTHSLLLPVPLSSGHSPLFCLLRRTRAFTPLLLFFHGKATTDDDDGGIQETTRSSMGGFDAHFSSLCVDPFYKREGPLLLQSAATLLAHSGCPAVVAINNNKRKVCRTPLQPFTPSLPPPPWKNSYCGSWTPIFSPFRFSHLFCKLL